MQSHEACAGACGCGRLLVGQLSQLFRLAQRALAPAKAAQRGLHAAVAASRATVAAAQPPLPHPRQIEASLRAEDAADSGNAAPPAKPPPLVFQLAVSDAAVVVPLHSTCALHALRSHCCKSQRLPIRLLSRRIVLGFCRNAALQAWRVHLVLPAAFLAASSQQANNSLYVSGFVIPVMQRRHDVCSFLPPAHTRVGKPTARTSVAASCRSLEVLAVELESVTLAMPGSAVTGEQLAAAELPPLAAMVASALDGRCDYARGTSVTAQAAERPG
jgi:hypothetical protein